MTVDRETFLRYPGKGDSPLPSWTFRHRKLLPDMPLGLFSDRGLERVNNDDATIKAGVEQGLTVFGFKDFQVRRGFAEPRRFFSDHSVYYEVSFSGDGSAHSSPIRFVYFPGGKEGGQVLASDMKKDDDNSLTRLYVTRNAAPVMTIEQAMEQITDPAAIHPAVVHISNRGSFDVAKVANLVQILAIGKNIGRRDNSSGE